MTAAQLHGFAVERFQLLIDAVKDCAAYLLDTSGHVLSWNTGAQQIFGYAPDEVIGHHHAELFPGPDRAAAADRTRAAASALGRFEESAVRVRRDGLQFWAEVSVTAIRSGDAPAGFACVVRDITERKRLEALIEQHARQLEDSNRDLEAFSYSVAHDLRAPLRAMNGFAQILLEDHVGQLDDDAISHLKKIQLNAARMGTLIDALLGLSRLSRGPLHLQPVDFTALARSVAGRLAAAEPQRTVELAIEDGMTAVADPKLARILLEHLLANAWRFTQAQPAARIAVGRASGAFFVRDNGVGFSMEHAGKLFTPFERLHATEGYSGTGIGLAVAKRIVQRHGGRISASAAVDGGATFAFTLALP